MENKLGQLLNTLIQRGWKPFGKRDKLYAVEDGIYIFGRIASDWNTYDLRQITGKESWLWQFVCENGMIKSENWVWVNAVDGMYKEILINQYDYRYRVIESSLKDESELEDFLLSNIKVEWND